MLADSFEPPYYAVVFTSLRSAEDAVGYGKAAEAMERLAVEQPGFLGVESARGDDGLGITVSYWRDLESIRRWREQADHTIAQQIGRDRWYDAYRVRVCHVEDDRGWRRC